MYLNIGIWIPSIAPYPGGTQPHRCHLMFRAEQIPVMKSEENSSKVRFDYYLCPYDNRDDPDGTDPKTLGRVCTTLAQYFCNRYPSLWHGQKNT